MSIITDFFGSVPIKRTLRTSSTSVAQSGAKPPHSGSKPPSQSGSRASSEVVVVPDSPTMPAKEEDVMGAEFDDAAMALILQEEEMEKAKLEVTYTL